MSTLPPDGFDGDWSEVMSQVSDALAQLGVDQTDVRDALMAGVEEALQSLSGELGPLADKPDVTVVEGGRDGSEPRSEAEPPPLRIAETDEVPRETEAATGDAGRSRVRLVRLGADGRLASGVGAEGRIRVEPTEGAQQTVFRGDEPRAYRVGCATGIVELAVDGVVVERIEPGQTVDVEARLIRVRAGDADTATGSYTRVED